MLNKQKLCKFMPLYVVAILATILVAQSFAATPEIKDGYYQLGTKADLEWFRDQVNAGNYSINAKLIADIDLKGSETDQWKPRGGRAAEDKGYSGVFDGQEYTISGLYIKSSSSSDIGFFASLNGGTIRNVTIKGNIDVKDATSGYDIGGICADARGTDAKSAMVENCVSDVAITVDSSSGGGGTKVGGISGKVKHCTIQKCVNKANIACSKGELGGICGDIVKGTTICDNMLFCLKI